MLIEITKELPKLHAQVVALRKEAIAGRWSEELAERKWALQKAASGLRALERLSPVFGLHAARVAPHAEWWTVIFDFIDRADAAGIMPVPPEDLSFFGHIEEARSGAWEVTLPDGTEGSIFTADPYTRDIEVGSCASVFPPLVRRAKLSVIRDDAGTPLFRGIFSLVAISDLPVDRAAAKALGVQVLADQGHILDGPF